MLGNGKMCTTIAVSDLAAARDFYGGVLGLEHIDDNPAGVRCGAAGGKVFVSESEFAGSNKATCASWNVDDVEAAVADLKSKGVNFEHYDMPGAELQGDVHVMGSMRSAWFKDPDGNILAVNNVT